MQQRDQIVNLANKDCFSNDIVLNERELKCEKILAKLREDMFSEDSIINTGDFVEKSETISNSKLFDCLNCMPKPGMLGMLYAASVRASWIVEKLCYYDFVYLNEKEMKFKVTKDPNFNETGFINCNTLRSFWTDSRKFDAHLINLILLE